MSWCPKCKNEYREGVTVCVDCGCDLVEEQEWKSQTALIFGEEEQITSLKKFMEYNKIENVNVRYDEKEAVYELLIDEKDVAAARKIAGIFLQQQALEQYKEEAVSSVEDKEQEDNVSAQPYVNSADRAEENRSSAVTLLLVGGVGLVIMILGIAGVLPFRVGNPYMFYGVMSAVFILFVVMGVVSMKNAKIFAKKAESENSLRDTLLQWCKDNLTAEKIDAQIENVHLELTEALYFKRYEVIKKIMNHQFMNLEQGFLEKLIDDEVYDMVFSKEE